MCNNPNIDLVNIIAKAKFGEIPSICFKDTERKWNADLKQLCLFLFLCFLFFLWTLTCNNPNLDVVNTNTHAKVGQILLFRIVLKILSGNEILKSIKGLNTVKTLWKLTRNNPNLDFVNINAYG